MPCLARHICPTNGTVTPTICPAGSWCGPGSESGTPCAAGTFGAEFGLLNASSCTPCSKGFACPQAGLAAPAEACYIGFYCTLGSPSTAPPVAVASAMASYGPCPTGSYCPYGTDVPQACPSGTFNPLPQMSDIGACQPCRE